MPDTSDTSATRATQMQHECDTTDTNRTRVRHECDTSETRTTRVLHECYTNDTSATRLKNFDFDNDTGKNIFSHPYIYYMTSERLQGEEQFKLRTTFRKCLVSMPKCV